MNVSTRAGRVRAWAEVDLANLTANARTVQQAAKAPLLPMVKANAYGLGVLRVVEAIEEIDPWGYGVATVDEAVQLREAGNRRPILVFTPAVRDQLDAFRVYQLRAVLDDPAVIAAWDRPFHLEIDTGMGRCGLRFDDERLAALDSPHLEGVFTHFFAADENPTTVAHQWRRFEEALGRLQRAPRLVHAANSAGSWRLDRPLDFARPGIFLYGGRCGQDLPAPRPVVQVHAPVVSVRRLSAGETVSYGGEWVAPNATAVATLGIGYADGVRRSIADRAEVLIGGARYPIVGRVTMDFIMVDVGAAPQAVAVGDVATVIGGDGDGAITVDEFAGWAGTISYEILTGLGSRLAREYVAA